MKNQQTPSGLIKYLDDLNIETRRLWKPLHLHAAYEKFELIDNGTSEALFEQGICLPSGTSLSEDDQKRVIQAIKKYLVGWRLFKNGLISAWKQSGRYKDLCLYANE